MTRLADRDSAEQMFLLTLALRVGPPVMIFLGGAEFLIWGNRAVWLIIPDLALTGLVIIAAERGLDGVARAASSILFPSGKGTPAPREYSEQEALVIRGRFVEAADSYRAIIDDEPANLDARMRLGRLLEMECDDPGGAEQVYRDVRKMARAPAHDWTCTNALIDLHQRQGNHEQLKDELAGLSRRFRNTEAGASARRRLAEIVEGEAADVERRLGDQGTTPVSR